MKERAVTIAGNPHVCFTRGAPPTRIAKGDEEMVDLRFSYYRRKLHEMLLLVD